MIICILFFLQVEIRALPSPPEMVKLALESVCLLLGEAAADWKAIRAILMKDSFIPAIVNFSTDMITDEVRKIIKNKYLVNPDFTFEKVNRASLACGPMVS